MSLDDGKSGSESETTGKTEQELLSEPPFNLTPKQVDFCREFVKNGGRAGAAARAAGYSDRSADQEASRLRKLSKITDYIETLEREAEEGQPALNDEEIDRILAKIIRTGRPNDRLTAIKERDRRLSDRESKDDEVGRLIEAMRQMGYGRQVPGNSEKSENVVGFPSDRS